jgi:murein DD-endopeptidase MepM/ murein hydrolase activator NlpD
LPEIPLSAGPNSGRPSGTTGATGSTPNGGYATLDNQFTDHTIVAGETLSSIAQSYGVSLDTLIANNQGLEDVDVIRPGQTLRVPTTNGLLYHVQAGDTLDSISHRYGVSQSDVVAVKANGLADANTIQTGQTLLLPGDIKPPPPPPIVAKAISVPASNPPQVIAQAQPSAPLAANADGAAPAVAAAPPKPASTPPVPIARFIWPIQGPITQAFGVPELGVGAPHTGIDIGLYGRDGAPISAAAAGTVTFSGGDACCSYGYYVIIKHAGGFETLYGHLSRRAVTVGETVTQGQTIGYAGSTGFSTGTHLHFEIHLNGALQNPIGYLP